MSELNDARLQIELELRNALGKAIPDVAEKRWLSELAADLAAEKIHYAAAATDEERARITENLEVLGATWKLRLAEKELIASQTANQVVRIALRTAVNLLPVLGPAGGVAKLVAEQMLNRLDAAGNG